MNYDEVMKKLHDMPFKSDQDVYIIASIDGKECRIGRIEDIQLDSYADIVIEVDIDKKSVTA